MKNPFAALLCVALTACADRGSVSYDGIHRGEVRRSIAAIERATKRHFKASPKLEEKSRNEVRAFLENAFTEQISPLELAGMETAYKRLGMIPDSLDLRKLYIDLLSEQVVGYYDPATKVLYVVRDAPAVYLGTTITHELMHALQDQYFPLDSITRITGSNDRRTAAGAVVEGHALWEQYVVTFGMTNFTNVIPGGWAGFRNLVRENSSATPIFATAPLILKEALLFPYLSGAEHMKTFKERIPGGWPFDSLPESTEQVLNADKYFGQRDHPTRVTLPAPSAGPAIYENDLGEFETRMFVYQHSRDLDLSSRAAQGWDGDRYAVVSIGGDRDALVWATLWDSALDAAEFIDALEVVLPTRYQGLKRQAGGTEIRRFEGAGRTVEVRAVTVGGRPVVILTDVPAGVAPSLVDPARIQLFP